MNPEGQRGLPGQRELTGLRVQQALLVQLVLVEEQARLVLPGQLAQRVTRGLQVELGRQD